MNYQFLLVCMLWSIIEGYKQNFVPAVVFKFVNKLITKTFFFHKFVASSRRRRPRDRGATTSPSTVSPSAGMDAPNNYCETQE
jgi:hypothetical protein